MPEVRTAGLLRVRSGAERVTNIELFFDLVYVFAITQLSHHLLGRLTWEGAGQTLLLLAAVWLAWVYTASLTNYLESERIQMRLLLLALMLVSLALSAAIPAAFGTGGLVVAGAYAIIQVGRTTFAILALRGEALRRTFERVLPWYLVISCLWLLGAVRPAHIRELVWALAVAGHTFPAVARDTLPRAKLPG